MPRFNVGDRVMRICSGGGFDQLPLNTPLIVAQVLEGRSGDFVYVEGYLGGLYSHRFELVQAAPAENREEITIYVCIYTDSDIPGRKFSLTSLSEDDANRQAEFLRNRNGFTLLALKKFKTRI